MKERIYLLACPLSEPREGVLKSLDYDEFLCQAIADRKVELEEDGVEVFEEIGNILIASNGYAVAVYESAIKEIVK